MTEEHNVPEAPERQETDAEKIERLENREKELNEANMNQANRIQRLSNTLEQQENVFKVLASKIEQYMDLPEQLSEFDRKSEVEDIARNEIENRFSDMFSDHIADVTVDIEINDATATLSY